MKVQSDTLPDKVKLLQGKKLVRFNIESYTEEVDGEDVTRYTYETLKVPADYPSRYTTQVVNAEKRNIVDAKIKALTKDYCDGEVGSFWIQETEARAYKADNTASTPFLSAVANARGVELSILVDKVISNADALKAATANLLGAYQNSLSEEF